MSAVQKAVASALIASAAGSAHALNISGYPTDSSVVNVYVGGSTAANMALIYSNLGNDSPFTALCDANQGTIDLYTDAADGANPHGQWMVYCVANKSLGLTAKDIAFFKESTLGSQNGSIPLYNNAINGQNTNSLTFINPSVAPAGCITVVGSLPGAQAYTVHQSCSFTTYVPAVNITGGVSEVDALLVGANQADVTNYLTASPGLADVWTVPVNNTFYRLLQEAEGRSGNTAGGFPSLSRAQLEGIYTDTDADLNDFRNSGGSIYTDEQTDAVASTIEICRLEYGSGAEAAAEIFWLNEGCGGSGGPNSGDLTIPGENIEAGGNVIEESSTGDIEGCLEAWDGSGTVMDYRGNTYSTGGPHAAIGMIGSASVFTLGSAPASAASPGVEVLEVDGALPTLENVVNGFYPFFSEEVLYHISNTDFYKGDAATVWNQVMSNIGTPTFLSDANQLFQNYFGQTGYLSPPSIYGPPAVMPATKQSVQSSPINAMSQSLSGFPNSCDPTIPYGETATYQYLNQ